MDTFTLIEATTPAQRESALKIREQIFVQEQGIPYNMEQDGLDDGAFHVLVLCDAAPVGTGRLLLVEAGHIARIAVLPAFRGQGLGRRIVQQLEHIAQREGLRTVFLNPHENLETFYTQLGYHKVVGGESVVGRHRLITMEKTVAIISVRHTPSSRP